MNGPSESASLSGAAGFTTTHWSVVVAAGQPDSPQAQAALETFCRTYWYPLYAYVRRRESGPEDAQDLTQEFCTQLPCKEIAHTVPTVAEIDEELRHLVAVLRS